MYTMRIVHLPALGKNPELRAALEERNAAGNAQAPHALSMLLFSPHMAFIHSVRFESLAAIEAYQDRQQGDADFRAWFGKVSPFLAQPQSAALYEDLVATGLPEPPKFLLRIRHSPV